MGKPLYLKIKQKILEEIKRRKIKEGQLLPSEWTIAKKYKVSRGTARLVLSELVNDKIAYRIQGKGTFLYENLKVVNGKILRKSGNIAFMQHGISLTGNIHAEIFEIVEKESKKYEVKVWFITLEEISKEFLEKILEEIDGILYVGAESSFLKSLLKNSNIPVVSILYDCEDFDSILTDNFLGGRIVAKYLCDLGHKRIGMICGPPQDDNFRERVEGFKKELEENKVQTLPEFFIPSLYDTKSGYQAMQRILKSSILPTAIFAATDVLAMGAMKAIYEKGLKIPDDISIVGFDNAPFSAHLIPPLTTVMQPTKEIGKKAMEILMGKIKGELQKIQKLRIPPQLVIRESTKNLSDF